MDYNKLSVEKHQQYRGKLTIQSKVPLGSREDLSIYYTPGVAEPCRLISEDPELAYNYTWKNNSVAVVSDGSSVLGLGNIGGLAGLPVMEGKAILLKEFGGVDAIPIVLSTQDPDEIIRVVEAISPTFGGINLEDIAAPNCFYIEEELKKRLSIPVFHDDQHGTAIVVLAGLINALKLVNKKFSDIKVVLVGAGAAGIAISKLLVKYGLQNLILVDSHGAIHSGRGDLNKYKQSLLQYNINNESGSLKEVIVGADVFIGVSRPNLIQATDVEKMAKQAIVFSLSNPDPEITREEALAGGAYIVATGRSDFPNQINNLLVFPGIFRGALDYRIQQITDDHKIAAAEALANYVTDLNPDNIIPSALDKNIANIIAQSISKVK
ncbi:MAG: NADP-dependent malic enzyme [Candidatus Absconditicoccaceae bacterium]